MGRLVEASNATLLCELTLPGAAAPTAPTTVHVVYKPIRGERPLDDFPHGTLAFREVAAWEVSEALGGSVVPPTVLRDGPMGQGAAQLWIDVDESEDVLRMILTRDDRLRRFALLDALTNNADRKGGHILPTADGSGPRLRPRHLLRGRAQAAHGAVGLEGRPADARRARRRRARPGRPGRGPGRSAGASCSAPREVDATRRRADALLAAGTLPGARPVAARHPLAALLTRPARGAPRSRVRAAQARGTVRRVRHEEARP